MVVAKVEAILNKDATPLTERRHLKNTTFKREGQEFIIMINWSITEPVARH